MTTVPRVTPLTTRAGRHGDRGGSAPSATDRRPLDVRSSSWILLAAVAAPVATAAALTPWRSQMVSADGALVLVVTIVAVASTGRRTAAAVSAVVATLSFDYFLTRPYGSFRITGHADVITGILLLAVGLAVGELAARGRRHRDHARQGEQQVALVHSVTELAATGQAAPTVIALASAQLVRLLGLRDCRFTSHPPDQLAARITPRGQVAVGRETWASDDLGLPTRSIDLPVRSGGWLLGHFVLTPTPGAPVPHQQLLVAVTIADQVGSVLAADTTPDFPNDKRGTHG